MFGIESSNIVGYTTGVSGSDNNFVTIPFALVGYNTADIQQIKLDDGGAMSIGWGSEVFTVWEGIPTVADGSEFLYWDPSMNPSGEDAGYFWGDSDQQIASYSIAPGQGVVINCAEDLSVTTAGQVVDGDVQFVSISDNNFSGNPFACNIDIQAISLDDDGAMSIGWGSEVFTVWEGVPTVADGSEFLYWDPSMNPNGEEAGYFWGDSDQQVATYNIPAGQGFVINCAEGLKVTIKAPYNLK